MHYARALVRPASQRTLRSLESRATARIPVVQAGLVDAVGDVQTVSLLHPGHFTTLLEGTSSLEDALAEVTKARTAVLGRRGAEASDNTSSQPTLYVKDSTGAAREELEKRQDRLLAKWEGRLLARDFHRVAEFVKALLERSENKVEFTDADIAAYRGVVEALCATDAEAALAVALNSKLPPLNAGASGALAKMVDLSARAAMEAFLDAFAPRDATLVANETCATQLACRIRHELSRAVEPDRQASRSTREKGGAEGDVPAHSLPHSTTTTITTTTTQLWAAVMSQCLSRSVVDPGTVLGSDASAVQHWASTMVPSHALPAERADQLRRVAKARHLLPRRMLMDALSVTCLEDLEREWVQAAAFNSSAKVAGDQSAPVGGASQLHPAAESVYQQQSLSLLLKDPKRYLVGNRLLRQYATLLEQGHLGPDDPSFAAFLEECGECHDAPAEHGSTGTGTEQAAISDRPEVIRFTMQAPAAGVSVREALRDLAPFCSYWTTLLSVPRLDEIVSVQVAPFGELRVEVRFPHGHECVTVAALSRASSAQQTPAPALAVLYEDDSILVLDKPAGLATTRHALSCTQLGEGVTDLVSELMAGESSSTPTPVSRVFRQGQVHRLDRETSGCLVVAKTDRAADSLRHQMGTGGAFGHDGKAYLALCVVLEPELSLLPLSGTLTDPGDTKVRTAYRIIRFFRRSRVALVECKIQQGKKHQIRRHLAADGLPILGDLEHGGSASCTPLISRVALHARYLSLIHPLTGESLSFTAPIPADFHRALSVLSHTS